jgi:isopentenyl-diphosphate delta-isomerase
MIDSFIIKVDENDQELGKIEKMQAHEMGVLHRAFSVFIFNSKGELMLQQRATSKYHSGGLWTNTCCSHPEFGENLEDAIDRRLMQEMGLKCETKKVFQFIYRAELDKNLIEHELDHVFFGKSDDLPKLNLEEASNWKYIQMDDLNNEINEFPDRFTVWLQICFGRVFEEYKNYYKKLV